MKQFNIQELSQELLESLPFDGESVLYNDGTLAYLSQGSMTQKEFDEDVKRIGHFNLSRSYWNDTMLEYDCNYDTITDDLKEDLLEHFNEAITEAIDCYINEDL